MNVSQRLLFAVPLIIGLSACAITQTVNPVAKLEDKQICVVENTAVRMDFLASYTRALSQRGYEVRKLAPSSPVTECVATSIYTANWRWDLAMYMAYADIKIFVRGMLSGQATYDSKSGGANMGKFISGDAKIAELVDQLLPHNTALGSSTGVPLTNSERSNGPAGVKGENIIGKYQYSAEQYAKTQSCGGLDAKLVDRAPASETYVVPCVDTAALTIRCEFGNCRTLR